MLEMSERIQHLTERREKLYKGGGEREIEKQHKRGKLTARERINKLFDPDTFQELELWAKPMLTGFPDLDRKEFPADGVCTGYGEVNKRPVCVIAQDFTVMGGTMGPVHGQKFIDTMQKALTQRIPCIHMIDSGGMRFQSYVTSHFRDSYPSIFYWHSVSSGVIPQIALMMGPCLVGAAYAPILTDLVIMVRGTSYMYIAGPPIIFEATGVKTTDLELGGAEMHAEISGCCDLIAEDDEDCLQKCKELLSFLPQNCLEKPPFVETGDAPNRREEKLLDMVPVESKQTYDMHKVIELIIDNGKFFELKPDYAKNMITGFARLGGYSVGIVANNPDYLAGSIDINASDKEARFVRFCDCFNIPLIFLVDTSGYLPGIEQEQGGIIRHGAKVLHAVAEATVPKITVYIKRGFAGANPGMNGAGMGSDLLLAWPTAEIALIRPEAVVAAAYRREIETAENPEEVRVRRLEEYKAKFDEHPYHAAGIRWIQDIIDPRDTRPVLIRALKVFSSKKVERPWRKHGNIPM